MKESVKRLAGRRSFLKGAAATLGVGLWSDKTLEGAMQNVRNRGARASQARTAHGPYDEVA